VRYADLASSVAAEPSSAIRARVNTARQRQRARFAGTDIPHNAAMGVRNIRQYCKLDAAGERLLEQAMHSSFGLSARAHDRIRKVARTIADLASADAIGIEHLSEAVQYRTLDRQSG
jgi:magnesium chelatase family protein